MINNKTKTQESIPQWISITGAVIGIVTLFFFMVLILVVVIWEKSIANANSLITIVLALGTAISTSFISGAAAAKGSIPIPFTEKHPITFSVTGGIAVFFLTLIIENTIYYKIDMDKGVEKGIEKTGHFNSKVHELRRNVGILRGDWNSMPDQDTTGIVRKIIKKGLSIAESLLNIPDDKINLGHQIDKYQYAAYAYIIVADVSKRHLYKKFIDLAFSSLNKAQEYIDQVVRKSKNSSSMTQYDYYQNLNSQIRDYEDRERILYLRAIGHAIAIRNGDINHEEKLKKTIEELEREYPEYVSAYEVKKSHRLKPFLNKGN